MQNQVEGTEKYPATLRRSKGGWSTSPRAPEIPLGYENMGYKWLYKRRRNDMKKRNTKETQIYTAVLFGVVWSLLRRCPEVPFMVRWYVLDKLKELDSDWDLSDT